MLSAYSVSAPYHHCPLIKLEIDGTTGFPPLPSRGCRWHQMEAFVRTQVTCPDVPIRCRPFTLMTGSPCSHCAENMSMTTLPVHPYGLAHEKTRMEAHVPCGGCCEPACYFKLYKAARDATCQGERNPRAKQAYLSSPEPLDSILLSYPVPPTSSTIHSINTIRHGSCAICT